MTGIGLVTPLGSDPESFRQALLDGQSGAGPITHFDPARLITRIGAQVSGFADCADRKSAFALAAARAALEDAAGSPGSGGGLSLGIGLDLFDMAAMVEHLEGRPHPPLQTPAETCVGEICAALGLTAPPLTHISACAASTDALGVAFRLIQTGRRPWMLAGGTDSMLNPMGVAGFCKIRAMSCRNQEPKKASRPFDRGRDGFLLGEGAALLVLENADSARQRGARIYAELAGYGNSFDAHGISEPHPQGAGALLAMQRALESAGIGPERLGSVNAHGTSTPKNDPAETRALKRLLGDRAVPVSSTKSMIGHLISASGAAEVAAAVLCARSGWIHPTVNLDDPDPECQLDHVRGAPRRLEPGYLLKSSFAFGGQNACLVLRVEC